MKSSPRSFFSVGLGRAVAALLVTLFSSQMSQAAKTTLADLPIYSASNVPANLMLALSVEFPTGLTAAYTDQNGFRTSNAYLGYFDNAKCYDYKNGALSSNGQTSPSGYFAPVTCDTASGKYWNGDLLNWATMTSIDAFRQSLTGGNRSFDAPGATLLRRSNLNSQADTANFPNKNLSANNGTLSQLLPLSLVTTTGSYTSNGNRTTPIVPKTVYLRSGTQGTQFILSNNSSFSNAGTTTQNLTVPSGTGNGTTKTDVTVPNVAVSLNVQIRVCVDSSTIESNCNAYGSNYKPEGLIQNNFDRVRVGASAYSFKDGSNQPNGVVRALLRDNGPTTYNGNGARQANPNTEWSSTDGTFLTNPDATDSKYGQAPGNVAFTKSGVINYLNQFGDVGGQGYEIYDAVGDLYWATLAYFKQTPLNTDYSSTLTASNSLDTAFPAFTGATIGGANASVNDPIAYTCQANAIIMIGDSHTHCDGRVPSTAKLPSPSGQCKSMGTLDPATNDSVDAGKSVTALGNLPLIEKIGTTPASQTMAQFMNVTALGNVYEPNGTNSPTYNMAGLAYYAHTNDIRNDKAMTGKQTVDTYVVDVLEPGFYDGTTNHEFYNPGNVYGGGGPNVYWLAAKYGGFTDVNSNGLPSSYLTWHTNTSTGTATRPDNYFPGNRPDLIQAGLSQIFNHVTSTKSLSASGPSVSSTRVLNNITAGTAPYNSPASGFPIYADSYVPGVWSGDVTGYVATSASGTDVTAVTNSATWSAQLALDTLTQYPDSTGVPTGWDTGRRVITTNGLVGQAGFMGKAFRWGSLTAAQQASLNGDQLLLNFLRGDRSLEGTKYNIRAHILGDIVDSQPTLVQGSLSPQYSETSNPGYTAFTTAQKLREPMVYVGANDGMLHAISADFTVPTTSSPVTGGGSERFAFVPSFVIPGPNATPLVDGIGALGNLNGYSGNNYAHHFYVNQTPQAADVDFAFTGDVTHKATTRDPTADWRTILVGGLGKGGKGIYALDITTPLAPIDATSNTEGKENTLAGTTVLWEFTDIDMGYSYARPLVIKTRRYGWVVAVTSGYNNASGVGYLYIISADTGALLEKISTGVGTAANPSGLGRPSGFTQDVSDNTVDQIYAGDLLGNVWRFDLTSAADGTYPAPVKLATLTDTSGKVQPITTAPRIELSFDSSGSGTRRWVFVGTGRFLSSSDLTDTQQQTMYALRDGNAVTPSTPTTPLNRTVLLKNDLINGVLLNDSSLGWYYDLTNTAPGTGGASERIVVDPDAVAGVFSVAWATLIPTADPCSLSGAIYSANFDTGKSTLTDASGKVSLTSVTTATATTNLQLVQLPNGKFVVLYGQTGQDPAIASLVPPKGGPQLLRTNWREILN